MAITSKAPRKYRIHPAYINGQGFVVPSGEYLETEIDVNEARLKSTVVLTNASEFQETKAEPVATINEMVPTGDVIFQNVTTVATTKPLKINTAPVEDIAAIKFVGKVQAAKIVAARDNAKIEKYEDLDKIAPIKYKKWQDIAVIDFELPDPTKGLVYEGLQTFGYTADNINPNATTQPITAE
jgi:DNA uptake protein ComE-like DNA-binding protein